MPSKFIDLYKQEISRGKCPLEDVSLESGRGLLPATDPLIVSSHEGFKQLTKLVSEIPMLLSQKNLVKTLDELPELPDLSASCEDVSLLNRLHSMATSLVHAYITESRDLQTNKKLPVIIPNKISLWFKNISDLIGRLPTQTYETYILQNYRRIDPNKGYTLENIEPLVTFTNTSGEKWFINMHVVSEYIGGKILQNYKRLLNILYNLKQQSNSFFNIISKSNESKEKEAVEIMLDISKNIRELTNNLSKMQEGITAEQFYELRGNLTGGTNGVIMEGIAEYNNETVFWRGATGAQSSIIPLLDRMFQFNVTQLDTMRDMENYMPPHHQSIMRKIESSDIKIRELISDIDNKSLIDAYNSVVNSTAGFRQGHEEDITIPYIIAPQAQNKAKEMLKVAKDICLTDHVHLRIDFFKNVLVVLLKKTKKIIAEKKFDHLVDENSAGKMENLLNDIQPIVKDMLKNNCTLTQSKNVYTNDFLELSRLHCEVILQELHKHNLDFLLAEQNKDALECILNIINTSHIKMQNSLPGTGGTDFLYFLAKNIEETKSCTIEINTKNTKNLASVSDYIVKRAFPSFFVSFTSNLFERVVTEISNDWYGKQAGKAASIAAMTTVGYSMFNIFTVNLIEYVLQSAVEYGPKYSKLTKEHINYISWAFMLLISAYLAYPDTDLQTSFCNIAMGAVMNFAGSTLGNSTGKFAANRFGFFQNQENMREESSNEDEPQILEEDNMSVLM